MSRVRNALKMAGTWPQDQQNPQPQFVQAAKLEVPPEVEPPQEIPVAVQVPAPRPVYERWLRRVQGWIGRHRSLPVPKCSGLTRRGLPCRAPAMSNGLCRMHGGTNDKFRALHQGYESAARLTNVVLSRFGKHID